MKTLFVSILAIGLSSGSGSTPMLAQNQGSRLGKVIYDATVVYLAGTQCPELEMTRNVLVLANEITAGDQNFVELLRPKIQQFVLTEIASVGVESFCAGAFMDYGPRGQIHSGLLVRKQN